MRKALEVARLLQLPAAHHWREAQHLGVRLAMPRDQAGEAVHDPVEQRSARIDAVDAHRLEQGFGDGVERVAQLDRILHCDVHV
jgi:hypothetical protein